MQREMDAHFQRLLGYNYISNELYQSLFIQLPLGAALEALVDQNDEMIESSSDSDLLNDDS